MAATADKEKEKAEESVKWNPDTAKRNGNSCSHYFKMRVLALS